jgi:hypothetical protein
MIWRIGEKMKKLYPNSDTTFDGLLFDGMLIAAGGFGLGA